MFYKVILMLIIVMSKKKAHQSIFDRNNKKY